MAVLGRADAGNEGHRKKGAKYLIIGPATISAPRGTIHIRKDPLVCRGKVELASGGRASEGRKSSIMEPFGRIEISC